MTPPYRQWRKRQAEAVRLYTELWWDVPMIAWWLRVAPTTVYRYLQLAHVPMRNYTRTVAPVAPLARQPYWELHIHNGANEVVCGRKFCAGCGRWRHVCDFPRNASKGYKVALARCRACVNITRKWYDRHLTPEQVENRRERHRIYYTRRDGAGPGNGHASVIDKIEYVYLPAGPLRTALGDTRLDQSEVARRVGISDRALARYHTGESAHIRLDIADRLALVLGFHLFDLYGDTPIVHNVTALDREVRV